jgi:hypothetical protein
VKFANPRDDAALSHSSEPLHARRILDGGAVQRVARERDESATELDDVSASFMRAPSNADAAGTKDAGEFHRTTPYAASSAEGCATRVRATAKRKALAQQL